MVAFAVNVYFIKDITPENLVKVYEALGKEANGNVAVKTSTGESAQSNHLSPELIGQLVKKVDGVYDDVRHLFEQPHGQDGFLESMAAAACLDLVFNHESSAGDNSAPLIQRINSRHGVHTVEYAAEIGLGNLNYELIDVSDVDAVEGIAASGINRYNVYDLSGKKILSNADNLNTLESGIYMVNGTKRIIYNN